MNRGQQEYYKRDYAQAKAEGKPFFPYAVYKDLLISTLAIGIVILLACWHRVEVGEPVNPASTDFVPRPEWYFFFLFELLKIFKGQNVLTPVIMATFIIPNMFARAARGEVSAKQAVIDAENQIKPIYDKWRKAGLVGGGA